ncbi:hypothetical protein CRE_05564 [Caenorhabditis remanei]|uniref:Uncharacterized protein n=1 Tax=Caenorhabditis remanei TaxID=31234 RepID=E3M010_CAERE|nr:hypothetical protein CRE_05564 [Caenorhabditis remanei]
MGRRKEKHGGTKQVESFAKSPTVMRFAIANLEKFNDKLFVCSAEKFNWTAHFYRGRFLNEEYVVFDIYCHCHIPNWSCDAKVDVRIWDNTLYSIEHHYELRRNCMSCPAFLKWDDFIDPTKGYIRDGRVVVEIHIFEMPKKIQKNSAVIVKEYPGIRNFTISVGKSRFYVNRELLAHTSEFFHREYDYGRLDTAEPYFLDDISPIDFKLYLDLTYHPKQYFSAYHAKDMLIIAKRFLNVEVVTTCQNVILEDLKENKLSTKDKARLAEAYDLDTVRELFNPETLLRPSICPRFMPIERYKEDERPSPVYDEVTAVLAELDHYRQIVISRGANRQEKEEEHLCEQSGEIDDDVVIIENVVEKENEEDVGEEGAREEEEDFDISVPSTSGCYGY